MKSRFDGYNWIIVLEKGELLVESLAKFAADNDIKGGFLIGLGAASWAELGFYHLGKKEYSYKKFTNLMEVTNISGNIAWADSKSIIHLHGTFSDENMNAVGGHVKELQVGGTLELFLHVIISGGLNRKHSDEVGINLLQP